jgi:hypothetical protein
MFVWLPTPEEWGLEDVCTDMAAGKADGEGGLKFPVQCMDQVQNERQARFFYPCRERPRGVGGRSGRMAVSPNLGCGLRGGGEQLRVRLGKGKSATA